MRNFSKILSFFLVFFGARAFAILQFQEGFGYDWGTQTVGVADTQSFTLENTSTTNTILFVGGSGLASPFQYEGGVFPGTTGTCLVSLGPSSTCTVKITFTPTGNAVYEDWADVTYSESGVTRQLLFRVAGYGGGCSAVVPQIPSFSRVIFPSTTVSNSLSGDYFTSGTTIDVPGLTVSNVTYTDPSNMSFDITSGASTGFYDLEVTNECGKTTVSNAVEVRTPGWVDLRSTGDSDASLGVVTDATTTAVRDATGMYFTGTGGWGTYVHFTGWEFTRGNYTALEWVFVKNSSSTFMVGIGSDEQNFSSGSQWNQAEVELYTFTNSMWGFYGNNGTPGTTWNQSDAATLNYGTYYKVRYNSDGSSGNNIVVYTVTSTDWDTNVTTVNTTASTNTANATNLRPMVLPNTVGTSWRAVAFRLYP
ncbi:MAG: hypothetical protein KDD51_12640 [Bdellovibrionales bacterium]|nr:hypothetical protein [Bdellovibrionales bacterium]